MGVGLPKKPPNATWSSTLRLPKSSFPHRAAPADQTRYLKRCTDNLYEWQNGARSDQPPFILHDGPPYANGNLHLGHALNKILKDMICRVQLMKGSRVKYIPGFDCHGLPIELKALEQQRKETETLDGESPILDAVATRRAARALASGTVERQKEEFRKWAIMADWDNAWKTMNPTFVKNQLAIFLEMVKKGLIFRRYKPVYWSPSSRTALAEAELEYKEDHKSTAAFVAFRMTKLSKHLEDFITPEGQRLAGNTYAVIWTTTPWTLPANKAIAVNRDIEYVIIAYQKERFLLIAKSQVDLFASICYPPEKLARGIKCLKTGIMGSDLEGLEYLNPLQGHYCKPQPVIHADFVSEGSGTGLVHCAPGHGMEDYEVCMEHGIKAFAPVDDNGCFTSHALLEDPTRLDGISVLKNGSKEVLKILAGQVLGTHTIRHKYPYDWRTKEPVIVRATRQWFADVGSIKDQALKTLDDVKFIPEGGRQRLKSFVTGRSEWCISRQRAWGVPIPALYDKNGVPVLDEVSVKHIMNVIDERGIDAWWTDGPTSKEWIHPELNHLDRHSRGMDTMDVWFDSGSSWKLHEGQADVYCEGTDQHRGWFQSSLLTHTSAATDGSVAPFKTVITHGMTLDAKGRKMSKSIGNGIVPSQVMNGSLLPPIKQKDKSLPPRHDALGADALRLWVASSDYTSDVSVGEPVLKSIHTTLIKYRNTIKMLLGSMHQDAGTERTVLDMIALIQLHEVMETVFIAYENHEFYKGIKAIDKWLNTELSAFYMDAIKDRLYTGDGGSVFPEIYDGFMAMIAPITPMLVEEAWEHTPEWIKADRTHPLQQTYESVLRSIKPAGEEIDYIRAIIPILFNANGAIKAAQEIARSQKLIGSGLECAIILQLPTTTSYKTFKHYLKSLESIFNVSKISLEQGGEPHSECEWKFSAEFKVPGSGSMGVAWVVPIKEKKCERCWKFTAAEDRELCERCEGVMEMNGGHQ